MVIVWQIMYYSSKMQKQEKSMHIEIRVIATEYRGGRFR